MVKQHTLAFLAVALLTSCADITIRYHPHHFTPSGEHVAIRRTRTVLWEGGNKQCIEYSDMNNNGTYDKGELYDFCTENWYWVR